MCGSNAAFLSNYCDYGNCFGKLLSAEKYKWQMTWYREFYDAGDDM